MEASRREVTSERGTLVDVDEVKASRQDAISERGVSFAHEDSRGGWWC